MYNPRALYRDIDSDKDRMKLLLCISQAVKLQVKRTKMKKGRLTYPKKAPFSFL